MTISSGRTSTQALRPGEKMMAKIAMVCRESGLRVSKAETEIIYLLTLEKGQIIEVQRQRGWSYIPRQGRTNVKTFGKLGGASVISLIRWWRSGGGHDGPGRATNSTKSTDVTSSLWPTLITARTVLFSVGVKQIRRPDAK